MNTKTDKTKTASDAPEAPKYEDLAVAFSKEEYERGKPQHSPLPWHVSTNAAFPDNAEIRRRTGYRVADCDTPNALANAKLIVASVNHAAALAEALRAVDKAYQEMFDVMPVAFQTYANIVETALKDWKAVQ